MTKIPKTGSRCLGNVGSAPVGLVAMKLLPLAVMLAFSGCATRSVHLFNGKDLTNFYTFLKDKGKNNDPGGVFNVQKGVLHVSGAELGYLGTNEEYASYHLVVEYRWGSKTWPPREFKARDSGLLFHMQGEDKVWPQSIEFNIIEGGTGDVILVGGATMAFDEALRPRVTRPDGLSPDGTRILRSRVNWPGRSPDWKDQLGFRGAADLEKPLGEWNRLDLTSSDGKFTYVVNGTTVLEARGAEPARGRILFQSEGAEIFVRRIDLTTLPTS